MRRHRVLRNLEHAVDVGGGHATRPVSHKKAKRVDAGALGYAGKSTNRDILSIYPATRYVTTNERLRLLRETHLLRNAKPRHA